MRILLVCGTLPPARCGVGDYTFQLATHLAERSLDTEVAVLTSQPMAQDGREEFHRIATVHDWTLGGINSFVKAVKDWNPDIVHFQYPSQAYGRGLLPEFGPLLTKFAVGCPVVQTWHEYWHPLRIQRGLRLLACDSVIFVRSNYESWMPTWVRWMLGKKPTSFIPSASTIPKSQLNATGRSTLRTAVAGNKRLVAYFGFALPHKGLEDLFEVADPARDHLLLVCELHDSAPYQRKILAITERTEWRGSVTITGFLPPAQVADQLAAADAVLLPFRSGGGEWNTSIHAAELQGVPVITTSAGRSGYDEIRNIYFAQPGAVTEMRQALQRLATKPSGRTATSHPPEWQDIANQHLRLYSRALGVSPTDALTP